MVVVTIKETEKFPPEVYVCEGEFANEVEPSPKDQKLEATFTFGLVNWTASSAQPLSIFSPKVAQLCKPT